LISSCSLTRTRSVLKSCIFFGPTSCNIASMWVYRERDKGAWA
jgi:hypothetical protein